VRQITSLFAHKVIAQADDSLDKRSLLQSIGIDPDAPIDPKLMVSDADYFDFFANAARNDPSGIDLALRVGAMMRFEDLVVSGDKVVISISLSGTHTGDLMGIPATGKPLKVHGMVLSRLEDGKIVEE